jgi:transcriptional regulator with XRE-family HTH domain
MKNELKAKNIILQLMDSNNISEAELWKKTDLKQQTVNRLLGGVTPDPRISTLEPIADFFNVSMGQLLGKEALSEKAMQRVNICSMLPVLKWDKISQTKNIRKNINATNWGGWAATSLKVSDDAFALKIESKSFPPPFYYDSTIIIDPNKSCNEGDIILIEAPNSSQTLMRRVFYDGDTMYLMPLKENIPPALYRENMKVCGVIVEVQTQLNSL